MGFVNRPDLGNLDFLLGPLDSLIGLRMHFLFFSFGLSLKLDSSCRGEDSDFPENESQVVSSERTNLRKEEKGERDG